MKKTIKNILLVSLPTIGMMVLVLELVIFRYFLPACEWPAYRFDPAHQLLRIDAEGPRQGVHTKGKWASYPATWQVNDQGWISEITYDTLRHPRRIAIIGDSFVEACQVTTHDAFPSQLHQFLEDSIAVYGFGISNSNLANYLHLADYATQQYNPELMVINIFYNDFSQSIDRYVKNGKQSVFWTFKQLADGSFREQAPSGASIHNRKSFKKWLSKTAIFRYLKFNLRIKSWNKKKKLEGKTLAYEGNIQLNKTPEQVAAIKQVTHHIIKEFKVRFPNRRLLFLMDAPRKHIYTNTLEQSKISWLNQLVAEACTKQSFEFIDLTPYFLADYAEHQRKMEFAEDNHWNAYGHRVVAETLYDYLQTYPHR